MKQFMLVIIVALALAACGSRPTLEPRAGG